MTDPIGSLIVGGIPAVALVIILVELLKPLVRDRVSADWLPVIAVVLGITVGVVAYAVQVWPALRGWVDAIAVGVAVGAAAVGLYSGATHTKAAFQS